MIAIKNIEMPSCCDACFALDDMGDYPVCLITHDQRGYNFDIRNKRMGSCPLVKCDLTPFEVLDEISSSYYGKRMFFLQENGLVYDRYKHEYITFDEAVSRMAELLGDDGV